jgi:ribosomal-protein-alanine N-acetyltransferase
VEFYPAVLAASRGSVAGAAGIGDDEAVTATRLVAGDDAGLLLELLQRNREFLAPWQPVLEPGALTLGGQQAAIERALVDYESGIGIPHVILDGERIVGRVTLSNIVRRAFQSCNVGYWVAAEENGRGHASAAVAQIGRLAFSDLGLHRLEAGVIPHNIASRRVLERNNFERLGLARAYLKIAGEWQDHILYQLINPDS